MGDRDQIDLYGVKESEYRMYEESRENKRKGIKKSSYYHRFFEGYAEIYTDLPDGKRKIRRMYAAPWKVMKGSRRDWITRKVLYAMLILLAALIFAIAGTRSAMCNTVWYGGLMGGIETVLILLSLVAGVRYLRSKRRMTIYEMKSSSGFLKTISPAAAAGSLVLAGIAARFGEYRVGLTYLTCTILFLVLAALEFRAVYADEENTAKVPAEATYIR